MAKIREYRTVACTRCRWRDFYTSFQSYPPRCPKCGSFCGHEMTLLEYHIPVWERRKWGKDEGLEPMKRLVRNETQGQELWKGSF